MEKALKEHVIDSPIETTAYIHEQPIKSLGAEIVPVDLLEAQAEEVKASVVPIEYQGVRGTCMDERFRVGTRSGSPVEVRPSVPGGPDIYALAISELTGAFGDEESTGADRLSQTKTTLNRTKILSGGHDGCAANAAFPIWMGLIADKPELMKEYAQSQMGDFYNEEVANKVVANAQSVVAAGRYEGWQEAKLAEVLGEEAEEAIEVLGKVEHEALTFVRNKVDGTTVDQNKLYNSSIIGKGSFVVDEAYADDIEHALSGGPDAVSKKQLAEHAREFVIAALAQAVPNEELYQIDLMAA